MNVRRRRVAHQQQRWIIAAAVMALILIAAGLITIQFLTERLVAPAPTDSAPSPEARLTAEERSFLDYVEPRLLTLVAESRRLAELGRQRSRNFLELQARSNRVEEAADEIDAFVLNHGVPRRFSDAHDSYVEGITSVRTGMEEGSSGVMSFDFDRVAAALAKFDVGTATLERAVRQLQQEAAGQPPTPSPKVVERKLLISTV